MKVIKRDNRIVEFDERKVTNAISSAFIKNDEELTNDSIEIICNIAKEISNLGLEIITVEEIQDLVEKKLKESNRKDIAKKYVSYRNKRTRERDRKSEFRKEVNEKLSAKNVQNQNANVDETSFGGRVGEASDVVTKMVALDEYVSEMARNNHLNNEIYIHDLNSYVIGSHNCLSIPFDKLLANGFNTRQTDVRPANSVNTAFQLVAVIFQLQSLQQFGGVSATHLDWTMIPYVRKSFYKHYIDGMKYIGGLNDEELNVQLNNNMNFNPTEISIDDRNKYIHDEEYKYAMDMTLKETQQAVEGMYHNLNTLQSRSGNQLPFTSVNYGTCTLTEGRMVTKALLDGSIKGVGKFNKTSIFPCGIFQYMKGVNDKVGTPNYDLFQLALKSTAQRLYPNYANVDWSGNKGYDINDPKTYFSTMG